MWCWWVKLLQEAEKGKVGGVHACMRRAAACARLLCTLWAARQAGRPQLCRPVRARGRRDERTLHEASLVDAHVHARTPTLCHAPTCGSGPAPFRPCPSPSAGAGLGCPAWCSRTSAPPLTSTARTLQVRVIKQLFMRYKRTCIVCMRVCARVRAAFGGCCTKWHARSARAVHAYLRGE